MKALLSLIISGALVVSGFGQTRNVLVGTNNAVVQPTNFWSADASNARVGLGLDTAATNPASAFQPSSATLSNLATSNGAVLTNLSASNIVGTLSLGQGGTGATNASDARTALGLGTASTNPASAFQASSINLTNLASNNGASLTNIQAGSLVGVIPSSNIPTVNFTNIGGTLSIASGGTGATNAANARQNLGSTTVGDALFVATNAAAARTSLGATTVGSSLFTLVNPSAITFLRINADNTASALSAADFRTALNLDTAATNPSSAFQPSSLVLSNLASSNGAALTNISVSNVVGALATNGDAANLTNFPTLLLRTNGDAAGLTNLTASNVTGVIAISNGGSGATTAGGARTNLGLGWTALINSNAATSLLGYTANGQVVVNAGTNVLTFTNSVAFKDESNVDVTTIKEGRKITYMGDSRINLEEMLFAPFVTVVDNIESPTNIFTISPVAATTRTNLGLGWPALTNATASGFQTALFGTGTNPVLVNTNGEVVSPTNFWEAAPITTTFIESQPTTNSSTNISPSRLLHIHSLATNIVNVTNTIVLPTNTLTFEGDMAMVVHKGSTNSLTQVRQAGSTNNLITLNKFNEAVEFTYYNNTWQFLETAAFTAPIYFSGTNATANAAASRTNLGLGDIRGQGNTNNGTLSSIVGGSTNSISSDVNNSFLGGGTSNSLETDNSVLVGGQNNAAIGSFTFLGGGKNNVSSYECSVVVGGQNNNVSMDFSFIGGGQNNFIDNGSSVIVGGANNTNTAGTGFIGGGQSNSIGGFYSFIGGGQINVVNASWSLVVGGNANSAADLFSVVVGGQNNTNSSEWSFIGGGLSNTISANVVAFSTISGGAYNTTVNESATTIAGGLYNTASGIASTVSGGQYNTASGLSSIVAGGATNTASGSYSFASGRRAAATNDGAFVWADGQDAAFSSTNTNSFNVRASGGMSLDLGTNGIIFRTNASAAATRTNLGLGATNNVTFSNVTASGTLTSTGVVTALSNAVVGGTLTATGSVTALSNVAVTGTLTATSTVTAKTNLIVEGFLDFTTNHTNVAPATNNQIQKFLQIRIGTNAFFLPLYQ